MVKYTRYKERDKVGVYKNERKNNFGTIYKYKGESNTIAYAISGLF